MAASRRSLVLVLAALAGGMQAAEPPAQPAGAGTDESIAAAKREFETLKGARTIDQSQRLDLSGVTAPTLHVTDEELNQFLLLQADQKKKDKAAKAGKRDNWLVDAMAEKKPGDADEPKVAAASPGAAPKESQTLVQAMAEQSRADPKETTDAAKSPAPMDNPLANYMSSWMTSKDFDLLKVKPTETNPGVSPGGGVDRPTVSGGPVDYLGSDGPGGLGKSGGVGAPVDSRPNPYLADLGPAPSMSFKESVGLPPANLPGYAPAASSLPAPKTEVAPVRNDPPPADPLKPANDAKYFPQLKRF